MASVKEGSAFVYSVASKGFAPAANYHKVRSGYTEESVEFLLSKVGLLREGVTEDRSLAVLELGCGTGKFTQVLLYILKVPVRVIASDSLESMVNKTGSHQCTRAICSIFAGIHSTLTPRCIDELFGARIPFQSPVQSAIQIPVRQSRVQSILSGRSHLHGVPLSDFLLF